MCKTKIAMNKFWERLKDKAEQYVIMVAMTIIIAFLSIQFLADYPVEVILLEFEGCYTNQEFLDHSNKLWGNYQTKGKDKAKIAAIRNIKRKYLLRKKLIEGFGENGAQKYHIMTSVIK